MLMMGTGNENMIRATADEKKIIQNYKDMVILKNATAILNECNSAIYHIERNGNSALVFTDLYLKLSQIVSPA